MGKTIVSANGRFEWDEEKSRRNKELHGLYFVVYRAGERTDKNYFDPVR